MCTWTNFNLLSYRYSKTKCCSYRNFRDKENICDNLLALDTSTSYDAYSDRVVKITSSPLIYRSITGWLFATCLGEEKL